MPTHTRYDPHFHPLCKACNITHTFFLGHSKTDQFYRGHTLHIAQTKPSICSVQHMKAYVQAGYKWHGPLFMFKDGAPLIRKRCLQYIRYSLKHSGYDPMNFNTHSFRIGAATTAAQSGTKQETIQRLGCWRSKAVQAYIRPYPTGTNQMLV